MNDSIFQYARISLFWNNRFFILVRLVLLISLLFFTATGITDSLPPVALSLLSILLIIELFFHYGITGKRPDVGSPTMAATQALLLSKTASDLLKSLKDKADVEFFLTRAGIAKSELSAGPTITIEQILAKAQEIAVLESRGYVYSMYLFVAILLLSEPSTKLLFKKELKEEDLFNILHWTMYHFGPTEIWRIPRITTFGRGIGDDWVSGWTLETKKYTADLTDRVVNDPPVLIERTNEFQRLIEGVSKNEKKNVLLIGQPGVGKTALVSAFAYQSFLGTLPKELSKKRVLELLTGSLLAGAESQGKLEERIRDMISEVSHARDVILYLPEMQNVVGGGGRKFDMSGVLLQALRTRDCVVIGTITPENYKTFIEPLTSFADLFEVIHIEEPDTSEALLMLEEKAAALERKHTVVFTYKTLQAAVLLSKKYIPYRSLPGKGIALLDEVATKSALAEKKVIEKDDIVTLVEEKTKVRIGEPKEAERKTLLSLEDVLHKKVVDQEEAIKTVSEALRRLRSGLTLENRPAGSFLFLGPTGVGKTATAKALAQVYFGKEDAMVRLDMSEYQNEDSAHRLLETFPEIIIAKPFSLILLDEFEKAHKNILDIFLQILEDGRVTDLRGRTVSFTNTIIIATSNAGSELIRERILLTGGSQIKKAETTDGKKVDLKALVPELIDYLQREGIFKTELLNRFDAIVVFEPLGEKEIAQITKILLEEVSQRLKEKDITVSFDEKVVAKIAKEGFDPQFGARPLRRFIQDTIEDLLSRKILANEVKRGSRVSFSTDSANNLTLQVYAS